MPSRRIPRDAEPNEWARGLAARQASGRALLDLTESNPTRAGLSKLDDRALAMLAEGVRAPYAPEPLGRRAARESVAGYYRESRGADVDPAHVVLTASTSEAYAHLFRLLTNPGDVVLAPRPSYPLFEPLAALEDVRIEPYRLAYDGGWHLDRESLTRAIAAAGGRARALIVVEPNHPTGSCSSPDEAAAIEELCEREGIALIADEVFGDFPRPPAEAPLPSRIGPRRVPTFVLGGLSKCCGLPHLKLAWTACAGPDAARARALAGLEWIADLFLSVGAPVQHALPALLASRHEFQARVRARLAANLACLERLVTQQPELGVLPAHGGWTAVLRVPNRRSDEAWALALLERDVVVHPGHFYDFDDEHHIVVSLLTPEATFAAGLERLAETVAAS